MTDVYTDGACSGTPGPGGWGWAIRNGPEGCGYVSSTTNQRMEMQAVLEALKALTGLSTVKHASLTIVTDSAYVSNCFLKKWYINWEKNGWKNAKSKPIANRDIWEQLIPFVLNNGVHFRHVRGHQGNEMNEYVDRLCVAAKKTGMQPAHARLHE